MRVRLERGPNYVNFGSAPRVIRTPDLLIRSQTLYPTELWARGEKRLVLARLSPVNRAPLHRLSPPRPSDCPPSVRVRPPSPPSERGGRRRVDVGGGSSRCKTHSEEG